MTPSGKLILVVGLPGSGKGTLMSFAREHFPEISFPVSWTTRAKRPGEREGLVYHFATEEEFTKAIELGAFLEWVSIDGGHRYGTLKREFIEPLAEGKLVMCEVEVQGARSMHALLPHTSIFTIFIPSGSDWEDLSARMLARAPMSAEELAARKERYERELLFKDEADYVIINAPGKLEEAEWRMRDIINEIKAR